MSQLDEIIASASASSMNATLRAGTQVVSATQTVTFTKYVRVVLPLDGSVFWVNAALQGDTTPPVSVLGSLHLDMAKQQDESETYSRISATFTSEQDVAQNFDALTETDILIGTATQGMVGEQPTSVGEAGFPVRIAFSRLGFYQNAGIFHYSGVALMPHMTSQVIDALPFNQAQVVSNSLPFFLALSNYGLNAPGGPFYGFGNTIPLYPSMLVPANLTPPYGSVHIPPSATAALASTPYLDQLYGHYQLTMDRVVVTLYGVYNDAAQTFLDCVLQRSRDYGQFGIMNCPIVQDEKSGQNDLSILAVKKRLEFEVSYLQTSARDIARQLIENAICGVQPVYPATWPLNPVPPGPPS